MGVSVTERGHFLLASAAQRIFVVDPHKRVVVRLFEAPVWPSLRLNFGECAMLVAGEGWIGSFSPSTSRLALFSEEGTPLATVALDRRLKYGGHFISAIGGSGDRLAIGSRLEKDVRVFQLGGSVLSRAYVAPSPSTVRGVAR